MKGVSESMQKLAWNGLERDEGDEGLRELWAGQDVMQFLCEETKEAGISSKGKIAADPFLRLLAGSDTKETPSTFHQGSLFTSAKRQRKGYKPSRVPPTCENSLPTVEKCGHIVERHGSPVPTTEVTAHIEQQPGASLPKLEKTAHLAKQEQKLMKTLETPLPTIENFTLIDKQQQNGMMKLEPTMGKSVPQPQNGIKSFKPTIENFTLVDKQQQNGMMKLEPTMGQFTHAVPQPQNGIKKLETSLPTMGKYALTDKKLLNGTKKHELEPFTYLHKLQQNENKIDLHCRTICRNVVCKAQLSSGASFCRHCSCCICKIVDDDKDPSLWIPCNPEIGGCGLFSHIECALKQRVAGVVMTNGSIPPLDGSYFCQSCGRITPLIGCLKKQLLVAKDARRVDLLQHRLLLSHRLLKGTKWHKHVHGPINEAVRKLEAEVGQMAAGSTKLAWCTVNMLSCYGEVQKLISLALEKVDFPSLDNIEDTEHTVFINARKAGETTSKCVNEVFDLNYHMNELKSGCKVQDFEEVLGGQHEQAQNVSLVSSCMPMEQKEDAKCFDYLSPPSCAKTHAISSEWGGRKLAFSNTLGVHQDRILYSMEVKNPLKFEMARTATVNVSMRKSPCVDMERQDEDAPQVCHPCHSEIKNRNKQVFLLDTVGCLQSTTVSEICPTMRKGSTTEVLECNHPSQSWFMQVHSKDKGNRMNTQAGMGIVQESHDHKEDVINCSGEAEFKNYEFSVKVIRWLECEGHLKEEFRMKFLTWYTLRATEHEKRVISIFIDTLQDDPASLAGQLMDAFEDIIAAKRHQMTVDGYCTSLW